MDRLGVRFGLTAVPLVSVAVVISALGVVPLLTAQPASGGTFGEVVVTSDGDDEEDNSECTLREAIRAHNMGANYHGCVGSGAGADSITFDLDGVNPLINVPGADLPVITSPVTIDGNSGGAEKVELRGPGGQLVLDMYGLVVNAAGTSIRNLVINSFPTGAIRINADNVSILGNRLGTDASGTVAMPNGNGIEIHGAGAQIGSATGTTLGGPCTGDCNLISGNNSHGIQSMLTATNLVIKGNFIGTEVTGTADLGNGFGGILTNAGTGLEIGSVEPNGAGNVVSGNGAAGIVVEGDGAKVQANRIGTNVTGDMAIPNGSFGLEVRADNADVQANLISGNSISGLLIAVASGADVRANVIGADATGTFAVPNGAHGLHIGNASGNAIGDPMPGAENIISGNTLSGVRISGALSAENQIVGNLIGLQADGESALGNGEHGVWIEDAASGNSIGYVDPADGNRIAYNGLDGIYIEAGIGNDILRNAIFENGGLGIDLAPDGVTPNDPVAGDPDDGPNALQNFPVLTMVSAVQDGTRFQGVLNGEPNTEYIVQYFDNDECDPSGHGEGQRPLLPAFMFGGGVSDGNGDLVLDDVLPVEFASLHFVTATVTWDGMPHNASEFSACFEIEQPTPTPTPSATPGPSPSVTPTPTATPPASATPTPTPTPVGQTPTPTPTAAPGGFTQGDNDCDGDSDAVDALVSLQSSAALPYNQTPGCVELGEAVPAGGEPQLFGDIDCDGDVDAVDALQILRNVAGLAVNHEDGCPAIGEEL